MSIDVKYPKVHHSGGVRSDRRWGSFRQADPSRRPQHIFIRCKEISLVPRTKTSHTYFQNNIIHKYMVMGDKSLHPELFPSPHTHTYLHTHRSKKVTVESIYPKEIGHLQFYLCSLPFNNSISPPQIPPIPTLKQPLSIPISRRPNFPHQALATFG